MSTQFNPLTMPAQILTLAELHLSVESLAQYLRTLPQLNPHALTLEHLATPLGRKLFQSIALSSDFCEQENLYGLKLYSCLSEADNPEVLGDPFTRSLAELKTRYFFMVDPTFPWEGEAPTPEHYLLLRDKPSTFLAWIVRMSFIKRWALMHCFRDENVSEHSHQTAVIAHMLGVIHNELKVQPPVNPSDVALADGAAAIAPGAMDWLGLALVCFVLPAVICWALGLLCRKIGWIKEGDLKLN